MNNCETEYPKLHKKKERKKEQVKILIIRYIYKY